MHRRQFLGLAAGLTGVSGCLNGTDIETRPTNGTNNGTSDEDGRPVSPSVVRPEPTLPASELPRELGRPMFNPSVVDLETVPFTLTSFPQEPPITYLGRTTVGVQLMETATTESPAKLVVAVTNDNDFEYTYIMRQVPPFERTPLPMNEDSDSICLVPTRDNPLVPEDWVPEVTREDGFWRLDDSISDWLPEAFKLGGKRLVLCEYMVVAHPDHTPERGTYSIQGGRWGGLSLAFWRTESPGPTGSSRFKGVSVPDLPVDENEEPMETQWLHEANSETEVYLQPSEDKVDPPAEIDFELVNHSHEILSGNPDGWSLYKLVDGEWYHVAPLFVNIPLSYLPPGDKDESELRVFRGERLLGRSQEVRSAGYLGGGRYAYTVHFGRENEKHAALFEIDAPPLELRVPEDSEIEQDGEVVVVSNREWRMAEQEEKPPRRLRPIRVEQQGDADDINSDQDIYRGEQLITEQLYQRQYYYLRYSVPFLREGADAVVVKAGAEGFSGAFTGAGKTNEYDGETYLAYYQE